MTKGQHMSPPESRCRSGTLLVTALLGLGLSGLVCPEPVEADAADNAFRLCAAMEKTGLSPECNVRGWGSTVDVRLDSSSAEARKICAGVVNLMVQQKLSLAGKWQLRIFSPYSGEHPIAVCTLK
jgi:hypothetical protein